MISKLHILKDVINILHRYVIHIIVYVHIKVKEFYFEINFK